MKYDKFLPLGTVVLLKDAKKRIMIIGFYAKSKENNKKIYDYMGCLFPEGVISSEQTLLFDHNQIDKIYFLGLSDNEEKEFKNKLNKAVSGK